MGREGSFSVTRCGLVVRAIDAWTGLPATGSGVRASLEGSASKPIRTPDGGFAFLDVGRETAVLVVTSSTYLEERIMLDLTRLPPTSPIVLVSLLPSRLYPAPPAAAGVELTVRGEDGRPLAGVSVAALVGGEGAVRGRLADAAPAGATSLRYVPGGVRLREGDVVALRDGEDGPAEWCRLRAADAAECRLELDAPLERAWKRGARLLPAALVRSDRDGTLVVPFRGSLPPSCEVEATLRWNGTTAAARWPARGGEVTRPGAFAWPAG